MAGDETDPSLAMQARRLLRAARSGTLATVSPSGDGCQPFASLITPAIAGDGGILLLLSDLSEHTRHLRAEPGRAFVFFLVCACVEEGRVEIEHNNAAVLCNPF